MLLPFFGYANYLQAQAVKYEDLRDQYNQYKDIRQFDSALYRAKQMKQWALIHESDTSLKYAVSFKLIGNSFNSLNLTDSAKYYYNQSIQVLKQQGRLETIYSAHTYGHLGILHKALGENEEAIQYYLKSLEIRKKVMGEDHVDYATILYNLGIIYKDLGDYNKAKMYTLQSLEIRKKVLGEDHIDYASSLNNHGALYYELGDYEKAVKCFLQSLEIKKKVLGEEHMDYASSLMNLGILYNALGDYEKAEKYLLQSLEIRKKVLGEEHVDYVKSLQSLGSLYYELGDYKKAEKYYLQSLVKYKKVLGEEHVYYAVSLMNLGNLYSDLGDYEKAENYYLRTLAKYKKVLGEEHVYYASSLMNLGILYKDLGDYEKAEKYYLQSLVKYKKILGEEHIIYARSLNNLGILYKVLGDYEKAEKYYLESLKTKKKVLGDEHVDYASSLNNLGALYYELGDYKKAEKYSLQSLEIRKKVLGEEHVDYANNLNSLGNLYKDLGEYEKAEKYLLQSLEIRKKVLGDEHVKYAGSLNNLGILYSGLGDYEKAEKYLLQSLEIRKKELGEEHVDYAGSLHSLGNLFSDLGKYEKAEKYFLQSLEIYKKVLGEEHVDFLNTQLALAILYEDVERQEDAYDILSKQIDIRSRHINNSFEWMSTQQKEAFWENQLNFFNVISVYAGRYGEKNQEWGSLNYNVALFSRGLLLEDKKNKNEFFKNIDNDSVYSVLSKLQWRYKLLVKLESDGSVEFDRIKRLQTEIDSLDKAIILNWPEYKAQKEYFTIQWQDIQQKLSSEEAAIEFVRYKNENDSSYYYHALVLRSGYAYPQVVPLCREEAFQKLNPQYDYTTYYSLVWSPLDSLLNGIRTIYYSPTGELYNVPFHALYSSPIRPNNDSLSMIGKIDYLMDRYSLHQLTSTRLIALGLKNKAKKPIANSLAILGGINYDYLPNNSNKIVESIDNQMTFRSSQGAGSGIATVSLNSIDNYSNEAKKLPYLIGTKQELDAINEAALTSGWTTATLEDNSASEEKLLSMDGNQAPAVLHIATHGYSFNAYDFSDTNINTKSLQYSYRYNKNPMVRSGLILAGGNWAWTGSDTLVKMGRQNGILTALEVSQMDLRQTKLVVLSACETGLGTIQGAEGIFGLKRGFKLAGVDQMIISLWSVPDKETYELMNLFYENLTDNSNVVLSFQNAQKEMRRRYALKPDKWAGFVLVR